MIEISTNKTFAENYAQKHNADAKFGRYRYDTRFAIPVYDDAGELARYKVFKSRILVRHEKDGKLYLYDILRTKKETSRPLEQSAPRPPASGDPRWGRSAAPPRSAPRRSPPGRPSGAGSRQTSGLWRAPRSRCPRRSCAEAATFRGWCRLRLRRISGRTTYMIAPSPDNGCWPAPKGVALRRRRQRALPSGLPALRGQRQGTLSPGPLRFFCKKIE